MRDLIVRIAAIQRLIEFRTPTPTSSRPRLYVPLIGKRLRQQRREVEGLRVGVGVLGANSSDKLPQPPSFRVLYNKRYRSIP